MDRHIGRNNVFFVTGARSGGSVANLLSKKLIDRYGSDKVYSYTFNAVSTINGNMIPSGVRLHNEPYFSIFNIYNDDNIGVMFTNERTNMYKYGTNIHMSLSDALRGRDGGKIGDEFKRIHGSEYNVNMKERVEEYIKLYYREDISNKIIKFDESINDKLIPIGEDKKGYTNEEIMEAWIIFFMSEYNRDGKDLDEIPKDKINDLDKIGFQIDSYKSQIGELNIKNSSDYIAYLAIIGEIRSKFEMLNSFGDGTNDLNELDGYPFIDSYEIGFNTIKSINFDYQKGKSDITKENKCINIGGSNLMFSNYTIEATKDVDCWDISYSQFWNEDDSKIQNDLGYNINDYNPHYFLYQYDAGDFSRINTITKDRATRMTFGKYQVHALESDRRRIMDGDSGEDGHGVVLKELYNENGYKVTMKTLDGRIIAAFPIHLFISSDESIVSELYNNQMHKYENYFYKPDDKYGVFQSANIINFAENYRMYRYVDVVMESTEGYQYVIPFMSVDMKALHHNKGGNHHAMDVDNTYGHVYDKEDDELENNKENKKLNYSHINPIEPYIQIKKDGEYFDDGINDVALNVKLNKEVTKAIFGTENINDKIVSIRIYEQKFDESNPNWWTDKRDKMKKETKKDYKELFDENKYKNNGIIVDY